MEAALGALPGGSALTLALVSLAVAAILATVPARRPASFQVAAIGSGLLIFAGLVAIFRAPVILQAGNVLGFVPLDLRYDPLAGLFLVTLGVLGVAAAVYAMGYAHAVRSPLDGFAFPVFIASIALVFGAANIFAFLLAWELMALVSAVLVIGPDPGRAEARAGYLYLALTHVATAAIAIGFAIMASDAGSLDIATFPVVAGALPPLTRDLLFLLFLVGFGTKAGMVPLHVWLPRAHPVAPSHVSALMSGVMVAAGGYALIRFSIGVLGPGPVWWALLVLALGAVSAVLGALYALADRDLKRLLAFSTIENTGIVLLGIAVALLGGTTGSAPLAALGIAAALFHVLSHGLFKGLLFLGAGAVQQAAGTRDLNRLGGLVRVMPMTALLFGVGAMAGSGLPPLVGYASEWLTFQGLLAAGGAGDLDALARFAAYLAIGSLALAAALGLATCVKATGMTFLALPRSDAAGAATEVGRPMRAAMAGLAIGCVALGIAARPIGAALQGVAETALHGGPATLTSAEPATLGTWQPALIAIVLACLFGAAWAGSRWHAAPMRRAPTWTCGILPEPAFEYTSSSFEKPARLFFEPIYRPERDIRIEFQPGTPFPTRIRYRSEIDHLVESRVYHPLHRFSLRAAQAARRLQQGTLQLYLAYTVIAVVILLLVAR